MPKKFKIKDVNLLLKRISDYTGESLDHYGLSQISDQIGGSITRKYLYYSLIKPIENASGNRVQELSLAPNKIDELARFLQFENFNSFLKHMKEPVSPILEALVGTYYSYVRKNATATTILQSPVEIKMKSGKVLFNLKGAIWTYKGEVNFENGCLFCTMKSGTGKSFHHVYKIGNSISPSVLMGIFSGVSSANEPLGGRCVLIRQDAEFNDLNIGQIFHEEAVASSDPRLKKLTKYFDRYEENNLKISISNGFDIDDLA